MGHIYLELAENTWGLADDATIPDVKPSCFCSTFEFFKFVTTCTNYLAFLFLTQL